MSAASGRGAPGGGRSWWRRHRWLIWRRLTQIAVFGLFLLGPLAGVWIIEGNLNASLTLDVLPLSDPFLTAQILATGGSVSSQLLIGAAIVLVIYALLGGRVYCSWVCPLNPVTDAASWLRKRLGVRKDLSIGRSTRYWMLAVALLVPALGGVIAWEWVNPVSIVGRGIVFGMGMAWLVVAMVFLFDAFVSSHGWCGRLCPMGAFYSLLSPLAFWRVDAVRREACDDCLDCFAVCPEPQVIKPALKGSGTGHGTAIVEMNCSNCGRCLDVCNLNVFEFAFKIPDKSRIPQ